MSARCMRKQAIRRREPHLVQACATRRSRPPPKSATDLPQVMRRASTTQLPHPSNEPSRCRNRLLSGTSVILSEAAKSILDLYRSLACQVRNALRDASQRLFKTRAKQARRHMRGCLDAPRPALDALKKKSVHDDFFCLLNKKKRRVTRGADRNRASAKNRRCVGCVQIRSRASVSARR